MLALRARELELTPFRNGALVDVPGEDEVGARLDEPGEDTVALGDRFLARAPRSPEQVMASRTRPDWWRQGRTELRPTTTSVSERYTGSVVSQSRSNSSHGLVNRLGNVYGMS